MKKTICLLVLSLLFVATNAMAQIGIGTITPDSSSILEILSTDKGVLLPRLTTIQRDAIETPATSLIIFNTTTLAFNYYSSGWKDFSEGLVMPIKGGTGISNNIAATLTLPGAFPLSIVTTAATEVTLPETGILYGSKPESITSAAYATSLSDETGTGAVVFSDSPAFTGTPTTTTATVGTTTTQLATTAFVIANTDGYTSINVSGFVETQSATDVTIAGMTLSPTAGSYVVMFNSQCQITAGATIGTVATVNTSQLLLDLNTAYNTLIATPVTNSVHAPAFGGNEILFPGVYAIAAAGSINGTLILDGQGDSNAVFIFKFGGAFSTGASSNVVLINGASACNIFWVAEGAISIGASCIMKGTFIANAGACFMGASGALEGRLFSISGAINFGPGTLEIPLDCNYLELGLLSTFITFTGTGAVGNTGVSTIDGDIATNNGAITGLDGSNINGVITSSTGSTAYSNNAALATFSIYQNGVLISNSSRTRTNSGGISEVTLQAIATVASGQAIDIRWNVVGGTLKLENRILTLLNVR